VSDFRTQDAISASGENKNVEPSAQFSDGDASDLLFRDETSAGAGDKP
jgi:hypothetical protein